MADPNTGARDARVLELRRAGATFEAIAEQVGLAGKSAAHAAFTRALATAPAAADDETRAGELDHLDRLTTAVWAAAYTGDLASVDRPLRAIERHTRVLEFALAAGGASGPPAAAGAAADTVEALAARRAARRAGPPATA